MKKTIFLAALGLVALFWAPQPSLAKEGELVVSAAASLTEAFGEIGKKFEEMHSESRVIFNFGASGALLQQIAQGAPVDLFATADLKTMDQAENQGLICKDTKRLFAKNDLVLVTPKAGALPITTLEMLRERNIARIALGQPDIVPAGRYAKEALVKAELWETLQPKLVFGNSVRQVLQYVSQGEVEAALVFATDALHARDQVWVAMTVGDHQPIFYPLAVVQKAAHQALALKFVELVLSDQGQEILKNHGFARP